MTEYFSTIATTTQQKEGNINLTNYNKNSNKSKKNNTIRNVKNSRENSKRAENNNSTNLIKETKTVEKKNTNTKNSIRSVAGSKKQNYDQQYLNSTNKI